MTTKLSEAAEVREKLAEYAHEAWSGWMVYLFATCRITVDGEMIIPKWAVERWSRQSTTRYHGLPEEEKESDRKEADKMLAIVADFYEKRGIERAVEVVREMHAVEMRRYRSALEAGAAIQADTFGARQGAMYDAFAKLQQLLTESGER